jgi:hypothetical protein
MRIMTKYFHDYRLPTEGSFSVALREYRHRAVVVCVAVGIAAAAAFLLALAIVAVQAGYWYLVVLALLLLIGGAGGGGSAPSGGPPPGGPGSTGTEKKQPGQVQSPQNVPEEVLVRVYRPRPKVKMLARRFEDPDGPPVIIEKDLDTY